MLQQLNHLFFTVVHIHQVLMTFADFVANFELFLTVLLTHISSKVFEVTARDVYHFLLWYRFTRTFWFNFRCRPLILYSLFAVETSVFFTVFLLRITMRKFWRHVLFVAVIIGLLQVCDVLLILKVEKRRVVVLIKIFLWGSVLLCLFYF